MSELNELKTKLTEIGQAFHEFKTANDARLANLEKSGTGGDATGQVAAINQKLNELEAEKKALEQRIEQMETKASRIKGGEGSPAEVAEHKQAFEHYFRKGVVGDLSDLQRKALSIDSDPSGGYTVHAEIESAIDRVMGDYSVMRSLATVRPIGTGEYKKYVSQGGATSGWVGERETRSETNTPTLAELAFTAMELYAEPQTTQALLDDSIIDIAGWLADEVGIQFAEQEGDKFWTGSDPKQPRGLLTYDTVDNASWAWGKVGFVKSGAATGFSSADKLIDLVHSLKRGFRQNATFVMNDLTLAEVRKLKDNNDNYLWRPGLEAGSPSTLLGKPVETDDFMPDIASNALAIAFGDFKRAYLIVDRVGVRVLRDDLTKKGFVKFYTTKRVGGGIQNFQAVKLMKFAA